MKTLLIVIHIIVSLALVGAILLHSGRGTGISNVFGGGMPSAFGGVTLMEKNLDRITIILAIIFLMTSSYLSITAI